MTASDTNLLDNGSLYRWGLVAKYTYKILSADVTSI